MILLIKLFLAYFLGEFLLTPQSWKEDIQRKKAKSAKFYLHILIHTILLLLVLWDFRYWYVALLIAILHGIIDLIILYTSNNEDYSKWFLLDQGLHFMSILVVWSVFFVPDLQSIDWSSYTYLWIYATAILFITTVASEIMRILMSNWSNVLDDSDEESLNNAGKYIGILERLFVFLFVVTNRWEGIGFLLAAKSIFRFGDLTESKDRKLTEYILIGTLLSFGIAMVTGMLVLAIEEHIN